jgi:hypothetical protein
MLVATTDGWPEAAVAIAGIALVTSVVIVSLWQILATGRQRMAGPREAAYRALAERAVEARTRTAAGLEQLVAAQRRRAGASTAEHEERDIAREDPP